MTGSSAATTAAVHRSRAVEPPSPSSASNASFHRRALSVGGMSSQSVRSSRSSSPSVDDRGEASTRCDDLRSDDEQGDAVVRRDRRALVAQHAESLPRRLEVAPLQFVLAEDGGPARALLEIAVEYVEGLRSSPRATDLVRLVSPEREPGEPAQDVGLERTVADRGERRGTVLRGVVPMTQRELVVAEVRQQEGAEGSLQPERAGAPQVVLADRDRLLEPAHAMQRVIEGDSEPEQQGRIGRGERLRSSEGGDRALLVALKVARHTELDRGVPGGLSTPGAQGQFDSLLDGRDAGFGVADQDIGVADEREQARAHLLVARILVVGEQVESSFGEFAAERRARIERRAGLTSEDLGAQPGLVLLAFGERLLQQGGRPVVVARRRSRTGPRRTGSRRACGPRAPAGS